MHTYLACFDITDDKQRRLVARRLEHFGLRVQYSVFEIQIKNKNQLLKLQEELREWLEPGDDLRFYHLCLSCRKKSENADQQRIAHYPIAVII